MRTRRKEGAFKDDKLARPGGDQGGQLELGKGVPYRLPLKIFLDTALDIFSLHTLSLLCFVPVDLFDGAGNFPTLLYIF